MPSRRTSAAGSGRGAWWLWGFMLLLLSGLGTTATLWATGFWDPVSPNREGQVAFPALARPVKAYEAITRDDLLNPQTGQLNVIWFPQDRVTPGMLRDLAQIIGRVVARDKPAGYILTERDLLPAGTRPGITAGVPAGKRSLSISVSRVPGLELLRQGDTFDLLVVLPAREEPLSNIEQAALLGGIKPPDTRSGQLARQTGIKPLVLGGTMVALTQGRSQSTGGAQGLTPVTPTPNPRSRPEPEIIATVAVDPVEVTPLSEALGLDVELFCVAHSGHPQSVPAETESMSLEGLVPVVTTSRPIAAYAALTQEDLADAVTGRLNVYYFPPARVRPEWITEFSQLIGRVAAHGLPTGMVVTEGDLLPIGTRPGITAAAPAGTTALSVPADAVTGLDRLSPGDRFAIFSRMPDNIRPAFPLTDWATLQGAVLSPEDQKLASELRSGVRLIVQEASVLEISAGGSSSQPALAMIAIPLQDVTALAQVLHAGHELFAAALSGLSDSSAEDRTPATFGDDDMVDVVPEMDRTAAERQFVSHEHAAQPRTVPRSGASHPDGFVPVAVTARTVPAHARLSVEDFIDPATGRPRILWFPVDRVEADWVCDLNELIDRVVTREISIGRSIRERDLLPAGSQSGATAGVPAGLQGIQVNGEEVQGLDHLEVQLGDRLRLIAVQPYDATAFGGTVQRGLSGGDAYQQALAGGLFPQARVTVISEQTLLVGFGEPVRVTRQSVTEQRETVVQTLNTPEGLLRTEQTRIDPRVTERELTARTYLLALPAAEVTRLAEALATGVRIHAVPLSGSAEQPAQPTGSGRGLEEVAVRLSPVSTEQTVQADVVAEANEALRPRIIEHIRGSERIREVWITPTPSPRQYGAEPFEVRRLHEREGSPWQAEE